MNTDTKNGSRKERKESAKTAKTMSDQFKAAKNLFATDLYR